MRTRHWLAAVMLALLMSCGGSTSVGVNVDSGGLRLILWTGNFYGERILDADNQGFAFFIDTGCLYNYQTGRQNTSFCITSGGSLIQYQGFVLRIANIRLTNGVCASALVDETTARFIDIELDRWGREVVFITSLQPALCIV